MKTKSTAKSKEPAQEERELVPIRVAGVPEHFNLPWMLALERRSFVRSGLDVQWRTVPEGTGAMCNLLDEGAVDVAILVTEGAVRYLLNGGNAKIISPYVDTPLTWGVHVGAGTEVRTPKDLDRVRYAISRPNSGSHLAALAYAHEHGWAIAESDLLTVNDLKGAEERLQQPDTVAFLWEKYTTKPLVDKGIFRLVDEFRSNWPAFMVVATTKFIEEHRPDLERMLKVIRDQAAGLMSKRTAPEMVAHRYGLSVEDAKAWFTDVRWNTGAQVVPTDLEQVARQLQLAGLPGSPEGLLERLVKGVSARAKG
ncbi:MAG: ABC transporter substrate-binding protein [Flavobacteriales bacterium]|nr:ABC transporter substrate-binding protein [Flavobacteriales bacterium]MBP6642256.1 ABC transporter substrate-binding protein [Flavobacteriales bacterium]MBP7154496.1 ABC transporter substrate-binding protein [Flavobacteriales bacterium]HQV74245.1 ABC transporter substrate-binding protein [Flavobacteriales bacterium]HQW40201.1 ABC transporter substrate-binding protein [Flavobacteriales bacterium]